MRLSIYSFLGQSMDGWEFCKELLQPTEEELETRHYKSRCYELLEKVTGKGKDAMKKWGRRFEDTPEDVTITLSYVFSLYTILKQASKHRDVLEAVLTQINSSSKKNEEN